MYYALLYVSVVLISNLTLCVAFHAGSQADSISNSIS
jgi:hypothetical protein